MSVKTFFKGLVRVIKSPYYVVKYLLKVLGKMLSYVYKACDIFVEHLVRFASLISNGLKRENKGTRENRIAKLSLLGMVIVIGVIIVSLALKECVYFVPVGGGAVVTRFGAFNRDVGMGMHFRIPFVERYYIVQVGFIKEETFGFMQVKPPIRHQRLTSDERQDQTQYEKELLSREDDDDVFSEKGDIVSSLDQRQRLTHDYLREMHGHTEPLTVQQALDMLKRNQAEMQELKDKGVTANGRIPLDSESRLITRDLNVLRLTWSIQYRIDNMQNYLFHSRDVQENIRDISLAEMSEVVGRSSYEEVMTVGRKRIEKQVAKQVQAQLNQLKLGILVTQVIIIDALPVKEVQFAFDEVNKAAQDKEKLIYDAQRNYQTVIPAAKGKASKISAQASAYAIDLVNRSEGQAERFDQILKEYLVAPDITNDRLYIDAMDELLSKSPTMIVDPGVQGLLPIFAPGALKSMTTNLAGGLAGGVGKKPPVMPETNVDRSAAASAAKRAVAKIKTARASGKTVA
jgi:HflK protein